MNLNYQEKEKIMAMRLSGFASPHNMRSVYKGVPMSQYKDLLPVIDFTKYYVMFRGPRPIRSQVSTRKRDAKAFDVYQRSDIDVVRIRTEREAFLRGVAYAARFG